MHHFTLRCITWRSGRLYVQDPCKNAQYALYFTTLLSAQDAGCEFWHNQCSRPSLCGCLQDLNIITPRFVSLLIFQIYRTRWHLYHASPTRFPYLLALVGCTVLCSEVVSLNGEAEILLATRKVGVIVEVASTCLLQLTYYVFAFADITSCMPICKAAVATHIAPLTGVALTTPKLAVPASGIATTAAEIHELSQLLQ